MGQAIDTCSYNQCRKGLYVHQNDLPDSCKSLVEACHPVHEINCQKFRNQRLLAAARDGNVSLLEDALKDGANLETRKPMRMRSETCKKEGKQVREQGEEQNEGFTPLMHAVRGGHLKCVVKLLEAQASPMAVEEDGMTALHLAALDGNIDVFKALLRAGAKAGALDFDGKSPLDHLPEEILDDAGERERWMAVCVPSRQAEGFQDEEVDGEPNDGQLVNAGAPSAGKKAL